MSALPRGFGLWSTTLQDAWSRGQPIAFRRLEQPGHYEVYRGAISLGYVERSMASKRFLKENWTARIPAALRASGDQRGFIGAYTTRNEAAVELDLFYKATRMTGCRVILSSPDPRPSIGEA